MKITDFSRFYEVFGFSATNGIPFPSEEAYNPSDRNRKFATVRYLAFNYLGQLVSGQPGRDEYIPVARGTAAHRRNPITKEYLAAPPEMIEKPPGNSTNSLNLIHIDRLTGRARLIQQELN